MIVITIILIYVCLHRLRGSSRPKKPSLFPSFATRKYHYPGTTVNSSSIDATVGVGGHNQTSRPLSKFRPMPAHPSETGKSNR
ncbi:unnamed protein product [Schistosoma curassoni]|uniref:Secreted protein n=1 Tax=Schistosoma curassoni TaxID=6186 RepID=A0A183L6E8_9TREM|nr:unnamed protein product [Schistosoma curassoni]